MRSTLYYNAERNTHRTRDEAGLAEAHAWCLVLPPVFTWTPGQTSDSLGLNPPFWPNSWILTGQWKLQPWNWHFQDVHHFQKWPPEVIKKETWSICAFDLRSEVRPGGGLMEWPRRWSGQRRKVTTLPEEPNGFVAQASFIIFNRHPFCADLSGMRGNHVSIRIALCWSTECLLVLIQDLESVNGTQTGNFWGPISHVNVSNKDALQRWGWRAHSCRNI